MSFGSVVSITATETEIQYTKLTRVYVWGFVYTVIGIIIAIALGVMLNKTGLMSGNFVLTAVFLVVWAFLTFYPGSIALAFGIGSLDGLPKDWSINRLLREGVLPDLQLSNVAKKGLGFTRAYVRWSARLAFFTTIVFVTLGTWKIESGSVVLPVFVVLSGIGLWAALFTTGTVWYKRVTIIILFAALAGLIYTGYTHTHPQDETVALIDETLMKNDDFIKQQTAKTLHEKVRQGLTLTPEETRILENLRYESKRAKNAAGAVVEKLPGVSSSSNSNSTIQVWDQVSPVIRCPVVWDETLGPWCDTGADYPPGMYRVVTRYVTWGLLERDRTGNLNYVQIPPEGEPLSYRWNGTEFFREFLLHAPLGGNQKVGAPVVRVGSTVIYDPLQGKPFFITGKPDRIYVGPNLPPNKAYFGGNQGDIVVVIERLRR